MVFGPMFAAVGLFLIAIFHGWQGKPHVEAVDVRVGYGFVQRDKNQQTAFQPAYLLPSAVVPLTRPMGPPWLRGRVEWTPELFFMELSKPHIRSVFGITPVEFRYHLEPIGRFRPYTLLGGGILYADVDRRETESNLNFSVHLGVGTSYAISDKVSLLLEYRHVHISNAGLDKDNTGIDENAVLGGVSIKL